MERDDKDGIEELSRAADALFLAMRQARSAAAAAGELSISQQAMLEPLAEGVALPVGELAKAAGVSVPTATRMLQQLEVKGTITRTRSPEDERRVLVELTAEGAQQISRLRAARRETQARGLSEFALAERRDLARQLQRLAHIIKNGPTQ